MHVKESNALNLEWKGSPGTPPTSSPPRKPPLSRKQLFFARVEAKGGGRQDLREGGAGRVPKGLTKTETGDQWAEAAIWDHNTKRKWKKAQKQKRNRQNSKRKHHHARWIGEAKKAGKSRFHIPKNVYRINERRCIRRKEYRAHMRSRVSDSRKKEEATWLRKTPYKRPKSCTKPERPTRKSK